MSVANWTGVGVIILGAVITALAVIQDSHPLFIVGAIVVVAGIVAGKVLSMAGYGVDGAKKR
ncbi:MAG: HGxxPAAW family protein [Dermatophilaceae bacterium]